MLALENITATALHALALKITPQKDRSKGLMLSGMEPLKSMSHRKPNDFINLFFYGVQVVLTSTSGLIQHETGMS